MDNRERRWYEGKYETHPPICSCHSCLETKKRKAKEEEDIVQTQARMREGAEERIAEIKRRRRVRQFPTPLYHITKLCLNLIILAVFGLLTKFGYSLLSQHTVSQAKALERAGIFIAGIVGWILLIKLSRSGRYSYIQPSLKITVLSVVTIILIFGLAGVEPIASYMATVSDTLGGTLAVWTGWVGLVLFFNPLYGIVAVALIIWIIITIRGSS